MEQETKVQALVVGELRSRTQRGNLSPHAASTEKPVCRRKGAGTAAENRCGKTDKRSQKKNATRANTSSSRLQGTRRTQKSAVSPLAHNDFSKNSMERAAPGRPWGRRLRPCAPSSGGLGSGPGQGAQSHTLQLNVPSAATKHG